jgi:hypothetical protein
MANVAAKSWVSVVLAGSLVAACGGGSAAYRSGGGSYAGSPSGGYAPSAESAPQSAGYGAADMSEAPPSPAAPPAGAAYEERSRDSESRPGLGTEWGENRDSRVSTAPFFREDPDRPFAAAKLFYNDASGVRAMARRSGLSSLGDGSMRVASGALTVRLLDSSGRPLEGFSAGSSTYVVGEHGQRYSIQIQNHTGNRLEAVASVDGLDVINGQAGSFSNRGYIVGPFATVEIDGFRRSLDTVAAFRFGSVKSSYAARKGEDRNVGVVGVAFFHERGSRWPWTPNEIHRRHSADPFPGEFADPPPGNW